MSSKGVEEDIVRRKPRQVWKSRVGVEVRMRACVLSYTSDDSGEALSEEAFGKLFGAVTKQLEGRSKKSGWCSWIAHGIGQPVRMDTSGVHFTRYEVVLHLPGRARFEKSLGRMALGRTSWRVLLLATVPHGHFLRRWVADEAAKLVFLRCFGTGLRSLSGTAPAGSVPTPPTLESGGLCAAYHSQQSSVEDGSTVYVDDNVEEEDLHGIESQSCVVFSAPLEGDSAETGHERLGTAWLLVGGRRSLRP
jgi:hypothetical protein